MSERILDLNTQEIKRLKRDKEIIREEISQTIESLTSLHEDALTATQPYLTEVWGVQMKKLTDHLTKLHTNSAE